MADQENAERNQDSGAQSQPRNGVVAGLLPWLITASVVIVLTVVGFVVGRLFGTRGQAQTVSAAQSGDSPAPHRDRTPPLQSDTGNTWYYELDPVIANLNEPGVTRYVRVGLTLEIGSIMTEREGVAFLDQKKPVMKHWLTLYLANQTIEDTRGELNLTRMQTQISNLFNEGLFPDAKPRIQRVLFKEFSIQ